jgi:hypothetical protein
MNPDPNAVVCQEPSCTAMNHVCQEPSCTKHGGWGLGGLYCVDHQYVGGKGLTRAEVRKLMDKVHAQPEAQQ